MGGALLSDEEYRRLKAEVSRLPGGQEFLKEHQHRCRVMATDEVYALVQKLHGAWEEHYRVAEAAKHVEVLRRELQDMSASIVQARREIASLRPKDEENDRISSATNELDQIVLSTERASIEILNAAERIMELTGRLRAAGALSQLCDDLDGEATSIFTACSFQDLTGQRTTKVVNALRYIEQRIMSMINIWGVDEIKPAEVIPDRPDARPDAHLLNGPDASGIDQDEVDRLLNGFEAMPAAVSAPMSKTAASAPAKSGGGGEDEPVPLDQSAIDSLFS